MEPARGIEPPTYALRMRRSTVELRRLARPVFYQYPSINIQYALSKMLVPVLKSSKFQNSIEASHSMEAPTCPCVLGPCLDLAGCSNSTMEQCLLLERSRQGWTAL